MKIKYLNENFKKVNKLKASLDKELTDDNVRKQIIKFNVDSVLSDEQFSLNCSECLDDIFKANYRLHGPSGQIDFRYDHFDNGILYLTGEAYLFMYTHEDATRNEDAAHTIVIQDENINDNLGEYLDEMTMLSFKEYCEKKNPNLIKGIEKIHVNRIYLWSNTPKSINGNYQGTLTIELHSDNWSTDSACNEEHTAYVFKQIDKFFTFCADRVILRKKYVKLEQVNKNDFDYDINNIINISNYYDLAKLTGNVTVRKMRKFITDYKKYLTSPDLQEYKCSSDRITVDVKKYLECYDLINSVDPTVVSRYRKPRERYFLTTASLDELEKIKYSLVDTIEDFDDFTGECSLFKDIEFLAILNVYHPVYRKNDMLDNQYLIYPCIYGKFQDPATLKIFKDI